MKNIKLYEDVLSDMQDLGISDKLYGWWVLITTADESEYWLIYDVSITAAIAELLSEMYFIPKEEDNEPEVRKEMLDYISKFKSFIEVGEYLGKLYEAYEGTEIIAWEMTPVTRKLGDRRCNSLGNATNIPKLYKIGKKSFTDFERVLENNPSGTEK